MEQLDIRVALPFLPVDQLPTFVLLGFELDFAVALPKRGTGSCFVASAVICLVEFL